MLVHLPSILERSPLIVAVSSGGASPVLARLLRARLETLVPAGYGHLAALVGAFRDRVKERLKPSERRRFWERVLQGPIAELVFSGREEDARKALEVALESRLALGGGEVSLVGAGPGDPDLLTFRALRLMQQADVVVYDRLVSRPVLDLVRLDAERIYAGKERAKHAIPQEDINHLLVRLAKEGKRVVRLKGGDPFIFGRGGEEIDTLAAEGIPFQVVPGITAASGCASYAGIPLTHRDCSQSVVFVTGHLQDGTMNLNWKALAQPRQTIVFYMGLLGVDVLCRELAAHGMPAATPAALVQQGTTPQPARAHRHPGDTPGYRARKRRQGADPDHRRRGGAAARPAQVVRTRGLIPAPQTRRGRMQEAFFEIARAGELRPGTMKRVDIGGRRILLANVDGRYCAADDTCTHEDASLSTGVLKGELVRCPLHGSRFNVCTGKAMEEPAEDDLRTYPVRLEGDRVLVGLPGEGAP